MTHDEAIEQLQEENAFLSDTIKKNNLGQIKSERRSLLSENEAHIINICKKIRKLAKLDRMTLDISEHQDSRNTHLFRLLDYCGVDKEKFVKSYLSNLQPYMLSRNTEQEKADNTICVLDNI